MLGLSRLRIGLLSSSASSIGDSFSPLSLFASGEQGAWYDPSDLTTMFQDTAGTTPVTATGQTVARINDKSQGLVLGANQFTSTSAGDWTRGFASVDGTFTYSSGTFTYTLGAGDTSGGRFTIPITCVVGRTYRVDFVLGGTGTPTIGVGTNSNGTGSITFVSTGTGFFFRATATTLYLYLAAGGTTGQTATASNISVKELPGNHATQATAASRPVYQVDGNGKAYLLFDGTDDFMLTGTITPGIDKAQVFAGVRKLSDAAVGVIAETSVDTTTNVGSLAVFAPQSAGGSNYRWRSRGAGSSANADASGFPAPITNVLTGIGDIAADTSILRVNGVQAAASATDQGTGNYLAYPLYIGRRAGTTNPFNGRIYQMIVRFGANLSAATITQTETFVNSRTGAY